MMEPIIGDKWVLLVLALAIHLFAAITIYSMIGQFKLVRAMQHYWLLSGTLVYALGIWVSHFIMLLTSESMIMIDWTIIVRLLGIMGCTYGAFRLMGSRAPYAVRLAGGSLLMATGANLVIYVSLLGRQADTFNIDPGIVLFTLLFSSIGTAGSFYLFERKSGSLLLPGLLLGITGMVMQLFGLETVKIVEMTVVLTSDRLNDYMRVLSIVLGLATLVIFAFSLVARYVERRYASMNERYKLLVENSIDMIAVIHDERWEYINRSGLSMFEADNEREMIGKSIFLHLQPKYHSGMKQLLISKQKDRQTPMEMAWFTSKGKTVYTEVIESSTKLSGKPVVQVIIRDISERKKNEELLINSEKLYVAGQLAAGIAHEIRNPLTSLKGFLQLIASGRNGKNYYDIMKSELTRIESIVSELLMLSKPQIYELGYQDIRYIMGNTITLLEAQAILHNIMIESDLGDEPLWVHGVENQLKQVFINVIKNAIEVMIDGGSIKVACLRNASGWIVARIADRGPGISRDQLAKIGQPFYTTKEKGTGLGLMVTYKIVDNHQGYIEVSSCVGEGTTFDIVLPYQAPNSVEESDGSKVVPIHRYREDNESAS